MEKPWSNLKPFSDNKPKPNHQIEREEHTSDRTESSLRKTSENNRFQIMRTGSTLKNKMKLKQFRTVFVFISQSAYRPLPSPSGRRRERRPWPSLERESEESLVDPSPDPSKRSCAHWVKTSVTTNAPESTETLSGKAQLHSSGGTSLAGFHRSRVFGPLPSCTRRTRLGGPKIRRTGALYAAPLKTLL